MKVNGPSIEPCGTPALTLVQDETCPFKTTPCFQFLKKTHIKFKRSIDMTFSLSFKIIPSCYTLWNTFDIFRKARLTLNQSLNNLHISRFKT